MNSQKQRFNGIFKVLLSLMVVCGLLFSAGINSVSAAIPTPTLSSVVSAGPDSIKMTWGAISGASGYVVYRSTTATGTLTKVGTTSNTTFTNTGLVAGKTYYYRVRAYATTTAGTTYGALSAYKYAKPIPATPALTVASSGYTSIKVSWPAISGANGYQVFRATSAKGTYTYIGMTSGTSYNSTGLVTGKSYYYRVRAYHYEGTTKIYGNYSGYKSAQPVPGTPVISAASLAYDSIKVSWPAVSGAHGYYVFRSTSATGTYSYIGSSTSTSYNSTGLTTGQEYFYKVRAYHKEGTVKVVGNYSVAKSAKPYPAKPVLNVVRGTGNSVNLSWAGIAGGSYYQVYRATSATGTYSLVYAGGPDARSYTDTSVTVGQTYFYKMRTYHVEGAVNFYSPYSIVKSILIPDYYSAGTYQVGTDIPEGEYLIVGTGTLMVGSDRNGSLDWESPTNIVDVMYSIDSIYVTVTAGQYITFEEGKAYHIDNAPLVSKPNGNLAANMYKVGRDIPAGEYVLYADTSQYYGLVEVDNDSKQLIEGVVSWNLIYGRAYITVEEGQYLIFEGTVGYSLANDPALDTSSGQLGDGMYKVGKDLPAGQYTVTSVYDEEGWEGYIEISKDSKHLVDGSSVIYMDAFLGSKTITVTDGQYITLADCVLTLVD